MTFYNNKTTDVTVLRLLPARVILIWLAFQFNTFTIALTVTERLPTPWSLYFLPDILLAASPPVRPVAR